MEIVRKDNKVYLILSFDAPKEELSEKDQAIYEISQLEEKEKELQKIVIVMKKFYGVAECQEKQ